MGSPHPGQKRRPPPIEIPPLLASRRTPGPNAFAIVAQTSSVEVREQTVPSEPSRPHSSAGPLSPLAASSGHSHGSRLPRSNSTTHKIRESAMTTFSNLMDQARGSSPRKSDYPHAPSRDRDVPSVTRAGHAEHPQLPERTQRYAAETWDEDQKTLRGELEAQKELKLFRMMGQVPETPTNGTRFGLPESHVSTQDLRFKESETSKRSDREGPAKSPRKKLFGVSIPSFRASGSTAPTPPMTAKVAKVLGVDQPSSKARKGSASGAASLPFRTPRSETSKSLPVEVNESGHRAYYRRTNPKSGGRARPRARADSQKLLIQGKEPSDIYSAEKPVISSSESIVPPTPPQKDTPPDGRNRHEPAYISWMLRQPPQETREDEDDNREVIDVGMQLHMPTTLHLDPTPSHSGGRPTKRFPHGIQEHGTLVEAERIMSARGELQTTEEEPGINNSGPLEMQELDSRQSPYSGERWNGYHVPPRTPLSARLSGPPQLYTLPSTVYTPENSSVLIGGPNENTDDSSLNAVLPTPVRSLPPQRSDQGAASLGFGNKASGLDSRSRQRNMIQSTVAASLSPENRNDSSDLGIPTRFKPELQIDDQRSPRERKGQRSFQAEHSSSQLTDMLGGMSPCRNEYTQDFLPNCPSAVPSPLNRGPGQPHPMMVGRTASTPMSNMPVNDHFFITNEHIDVVGCTLYDYVASCSKQQVVAGSARHEQLLSAVAQRFEDIKCQINSVSEKADHTSNQSHNLNLQLDKLLDFIKAEVVEPLDAQKKKMTAMEQSLKELQKAMQDLQTSIEQRNAPSGFPTPQSAPTGMQLPVHRSQHSLAGFYNVSEAGREPVAQMHPGTPEMRRYGNQNQWSRPVHDGRDLKEQGHPFSSTNPYHSNSGPFGNNYMGGFAPYGFSPSIDHQQQHQ